MTHLRTRSRARSSSCLALLALAALAGCRPPADEPPHDDGHWNVTVWGEQFEIFPEIEPLIAGELAVAHTHVTRLDGFTPLVDGEVEIVLLGGPSGERRFTAAEPLRPGIFAVEIRPDSPGDRELLFRVRTPAGAEEIRGGRVRVGTAEEPGGLLAAATPETAPEAGDPISFLKEQQWRIPFATSWIGSGELPASVSGLARIRPPAGGERTLTAPVDGVVQPAGGPAAWPYPGLRHGAGAALFRLIPRVAAERSLASLESELAAVELELAAARSRLARLEELLGLEAASVREVEEVRGRVAMLEARRAAAARDLSTARASRGGGSAEGLTLRAPFAGAVARVAVSPGATVAAGTELARLVRTDALWLEVALHPHDARAIGEGGIAGVVLTDRNRSPIRITDGLRLVSVAPEVSAGSGTVSLLIETPPVPGLSLGTTLEAHVLARAVRKGIVIPTAAIVDDGGVPVVYLQAGGESFVRRPVDVIERQGDLALVGHLEPGWRLVTRGGDAIRRSSLMSSGEVEGHVH